MQKYFYDISLWTSYFSVDIYMTNNIIDVTDVFFLDSYPK